MSLSLSNVEQKVFDAMVKAAYQSEGFLLRGTIRMRTDVVGSTVDFRKVGSVTANETAFQTQVQLQDPQYNKVVVNLKKYLAATGVDDIQRFLVNFDERQEDAKLVAMALGRRSDQLIIDALNASTTTNVIADGGTGFTFDKAREVVKFFEDNAVPPRDRHIAISAKAQDDLFNELQFTSFDFNNTKVIPTGSLNGNFVMGMNWHVIPTMSEGGLPKTGNIRTNFAWHILAAGMGIGMNFATRVDEIPHLDIWQIKGKMYAGAVAIDNPGIIKIDIDESV